MRANQGQCFKAAGNTRKTNAHSNIAANALIRPNRRMVLRSDVTNEANPMAVVRDVKNEGSINFRSDERMDHLKRNIPKTTNVKSSKQPTSIISPVELVKTSTGISKYPIKPNVMPMLMKMVALKTKPPFQVPRNILKMSMLIRNIIMFKNCVCSNAFLR